MNKIFLGGAIVQMIDKTQLNRRHGPFMHEVEKGAIRKFADAIGEKRAIYFNEKVAKDSGYPSILAPLTFPTTFRHEPPQWFSQIDRSKILHAEHEYDYNERIYAGQTLYVSEYLEDLYVKQGNSGALTFLIIVKEGVNQEQQLIYKERQTLVIRGD